MIKVTILRTNNDDEESNLPSRFFPGAGSGNGWFQLEQAEDRLPTHSELSWGLRNWNDDCVLMDYDVSTGTGRLVIVDWYAPAPGTVIELELNHGLDDMGSVMDRSRLTYFKSSSATLTCPPFNPAVGDHEDSGEG